MKYGKAVAGTTRRYFTIMGRRHQRLFEEARKRWNSYKAGRLQTVSYEELMRKYNR